MVASGCHEKVQPIMRYWLIMTYCSYYDLDFADLELFTLLILCDSWHNPHEIFLFNPHSTSQYVPLSSLSFPIHPHETPMNSPMIIMISPLKSPGNPTQGPCPTCPRRIPPREGALASSPRHRHDSRMLLEKNHQETIESIESLGVSVNFSITL